MLEDDANNAIGWMKESGLVLLYPCGSSESLDALWQRWQQMGQDDKDRSDAKSIEMCGMPNSEHYEILQLLYV